MATGLRHRRLQRWSRMSWAVTFLLRSCSPPVSCLLPRAILVADHPPQRQDQPSPDHHILGMLEQHLHHGNARGQQCNVHLPFPIHRLFCTRSLAHCYAVSIVTAPVRLKGPQHLSMRRLPAQVRPTHAHLRTAFRCRFANSPQGSTSDPAFQSSHVWHQGAQSEHSCSDDRRLRCRQRTGTMNSSGRQCQFCGAEIPDSAHPQRRYCDDRCKALAYGHRPPVTPSDSSAGGSKATRRTAPLRARLVAARRALVATQQELARARQDLAAMDAQLSSVRSELAALRGQVPVKERGR